MEKNIQVLKKWEKDISVYNKLSFEQAKELYERIINCDDVNLKKKLRKELIEGTLYVVSDFINSKGFIYVNSTSYDMNDVISACNEIFISYIDSGKLLSINSFVKVFDNSFYNRLSDCLGIMYDDTRSYEWFSDFPLFFNLIVDYLDLREKDPDFDYYKLVEFIRDNSLYHPLLRFVDSDYYRVMANTIHDDSMSIYWREFYRNHNISYFDLFDSIIKSFELEDSRFDVSKSNLFKLKDLLINNGFEYGRVNIDDIGIDYLENFVDKKFLKGILIDIIDRNNGKRSIDKKVIMERYGLLDGVYKTKRDVSLKLGVSVNIVYYSESKVLEQFRNPCNLKKIEAYKK